MGKHLKAKYPCKLSNLAPSVNPEATFKIKIQKSTLSLNFLVKACYLD